MANYVIYLIDVTTVTALAIRELDPIWLKGLTLIS